jgi:hypothetical protein
MRRLLAFLRPLCHSHLNGLLIAFAAVIAMVDIEGVNAPILGALGLEWQAELLTVTPIICVLVCLIAFVSFPVGNNSRYALIRGIGRIPVFGRYLVVAGIVCGVVLLLNFLLFSPVQSLKLSGDVSPESWAQIEQDAGGGVTLGSGSRGTRVFFLEEKRAAVQRALQKEHIKAEE